MSECFFWNPEPPRVDLTCQVSALEGILCVRASGSCGAVALRLLVPVTQRGGDSGERWGGGDTRERTNLSKQCVKKSETSKELTGPCWNLLSSRRKMKEIKRGLWLNSTEQKKQNTRRHFPVFLPGPRSIWTLKPACGLGSRPFFLSSHASCEIYNLQSTTCCTVSCQSVENYQRWSIFLFINAHADVTCAALLFRSRDKLFGIMRGMTRFLLAIVCAPLGKLSMCVSFDFFPSCSFFNNFFFERKRQVVISFSFFSQPAWRPIQDGMSDPRDEPHEV